MAQEFWVLGREGMCSHPTPSSDLLHDDMQVIADPLLDLGTDRLWRRLGIPSYKPGLQTIKGASIFLRPHEWSRLEMGAQNLGLAANVPNGVMSTLQAIWWPFLACLTCHEQHMEGRLWHSETLFLICFLAWRIYSGSNSSTGFPTWKPDLQQRGTSDNKHRSQAF